MERPSYQPLLLLLLALVACGPNEVTAQDEPETPPAQPPQLELTEVASGLQSPTAIVHPGDGSSRLFVLEQPGRIRVVVDGRLRTAPFLDISSRISSGGEQGLLGLAFHPRFEENGRFFINYTDTAGDTVVAEYAVAAGDRDRAAPDSERVLLVVDQPYRNHNGGGLAFGPDGYLYVSLGDGGSAGDPEGNGQDLGTLLGSLLRLDIDSGDPYAIPDDNPFLNQDGARPEIWAYGLRNPWRFSFDRATGDLWIADVGQNVWEEINFQSAAGAGGENYGWNVMEGAHCFEPAGGCDREGLVLPVLEYDHDQGCSITGGYRYRGTAIPGLQGAYLFGDYCSGRIWGAYGAEGEWSSLPLLSSGLRISAFGEDEAGELYVADHGGGAIYRIAPSR